MVYNGLNRLRMVYNGLEWSITKYLQKKLYKFVELH